MEYISKEDFDVSGLLNKSQQLFVSKWCEQFNWDTIDTYRVRVMNSLTILWELSQVVDDCLNDSISIENLKMVCLEAERILTNDVILNKHYPTESKYAVTVVQKFIKKTDTRELLTLKSDTELLRNQLEKDYLDKILEELQSEISENNDPNNISFLVNALGTTLLWEGFSYRFLYQLRDIFLTPNSKITFEKKIIQFIKDLRPSQKNFSVYIKFTSRKDIAKINESLGIKLQNEAFLQNNSSDLYKEFQSQPGNICCHLEHIEALDFMAATRIAIEKLTWLRNLVRYEFRKTEFKISPKIFVMDESDKTEFMDYIEQRPLGFISTGSFGKFRYYLESWGKALNLADKRLDGPSREKLINSFQFFRMGLDSESLESKFIHTWIALEYLMKRGEHGSIISLLQQFLPKVIATKYFGKILINLSADLKRLKVPIDVLEKNNLTVEKGKIKLESLFNVLSDITTSQKLCDDIANPLLIERISKLSTIFSDSKNMRERFINHRNDLEWNLQRIYRLRNKIIHSAKTSMNIYQLESNLTYYFTVLFEIVLFEASHSHVKTSIEDIFLKYTAQYNYMEYCIVTNNYNFGVLVN